MKKFLARQTAKTKSARQIFSRRILFMSKWKKFRGESSRRRKRCWEKMKDSLQIELPETFSRWLADKNSLKDEKKSAVETQQTSFEVDAQKKILSFSGETWKKVSADAERKKLVTDDEKTAIYFCDCLSGSKKTA